MVYFVKLVSTSHVKIGYSANVPLRVKQLAWTHGPVELLAVALGSRRDERRTHRSFTFYRFSGEWFEPRERLLAYVATVAARGASGPVALPPVPRWLS